MVQHVYKYLLFNGLESRIGLQLRNIGLIQTCQSFFFRYNLTFYKYSFNGLLQNGPFFDKNQEIIFSILVKNIITG